MATLETICRRIEMLVLDVDGVLSDGRITYLGDGTEVKAFHVRDGSGIKLWLRAGKEVAILSGRTSACTEIRAKELGITKVMQGIADKLSVLHQLAQDAGLTVEQLCFVGDDIPDIAVIRAAGLGIAVADGSAELQAEADYVTQAGGGRGAVREAVELILGVQGLWRKVVDDYLQPRHGNRDSI